MWRLNGIRVLYLAGLMCMLLGIGYNLYPRTAESDSQLTLETRSERFSPQERFGFEVVSQKGGVDDYDVGRLHAGWYHDVRASASPSRPAGMEYVQTVWVSEDSFNPDLPALGTIVEDNPGSLWLIGNEQEDIWQGNSEPHQYAILYHDLYTFIKDRDPTARVAVGGVVQATPLRMQYLDMVLTAYQDLYGEEMPVDVWNIHNMILREERGSWGCEIPAGVEAPSAVWVVGDQGVPLRYDAVSGMSSPAEALSEGKEDRETRRRAPPLPRSPSPHHSIVPLHDVAGFSGSDVWAVGDNGTILHYDGSGWDQQNNGTTEHLYGVSAYFPHHVWAVGENGTILYFDGTIWRAQSSGTAETLFDVTTRSPQDVWAVGTGGTILHYDGSTWSAQPSGTTEALRSVSAYAWQIAWAVGDEGVILRYNGLSWNPQSSGTTENLRAVSAHSTTDVWTVGDQGTVLHYDGITWSSQASGTAVNLHGVAAYSPETVWAVGGNGTILHYDGTAWSESTSDSMDLLDPASSRPWTPDFGLRTISGAGSTSDFGLRTPDYFSVAYVPQRMLYEIQDNDDIEIFKGHIRAFRKWMKARGQQDKPLIISEYGVLMPVLYGFDHGRLKAFMYASFDYMLTAVDAELGYPEDGNRLVQRWAWYSLNDQPWNIGTGEGFNGNLFDPETRGITPLGEDYAIYVITADRDCVTIFGDLDCNCQIDISDIMIVADFWRAAPGDFGDHPEYDVDQDGDIDVADVMGIVARWGHTCG